MNSLLNPHFFFLLLNLMIGTIAFTSTFNNRQQNQQKQATDRENQNEEIQQPQQQSSSIPGSNQIGSTAPTNHIGSEEFHDPPSSIRAQVHSLQDSGIHFPETLTLDPQETDFGKEDAEAPTLDDVYVQAVVNKSSRTTPELVKESREIPVKSKGRMKKSVSMKAEIKAAAEAEEEEEDSIEARRPATMREGRGKMAEKDEYEVDAKADDFINRFKQELMLQRMDSIGRKREIRVKK